MTQVRVTSGKERKPDPKMYSAGTDGYVYTLEYDDPKMPPKYVVLLGFKNDLFKPNPDCNYVSDDCLHHYEDKAHKHGNKQYKAAEHLHLMKDFPLSRLEFTGEAILPDDLKAIQEYEINWAKSFQTTNGYWPPALEGALEPITLSLLPSANTRGQLRKSVADRSGPQKWDYQEIWIGRPSCDRTSRVGRAAQTADKTNSGHGTKIRPSLTKSCRYGPYPAFPYPACR